MMSHLGDSESSQCPKHNWNNVGITNPLLQGRRMARLLLAMALLATATPALAGEYSSGNLTGCELPPPAQPAQH